MSDRPPLHPTVWEQIERAAKHVDADYWRQLKGFQVHYQGPSTLSPAKTPQLLQNRLEMYAGALFRVEGDQYPKGDERYGDWLADLSERIVERVMLAVEEIEATESPAKLSYHRLSAEEMQSGLERFLAVVVSEYSGEPIAAKAKQDIPKPQLEPTPEDVDSDLEIARRRSLLAAYKAANHDVSSKRIYEARNSGVYKPEFYQWLNGKLPTNSAPAQNLERFLTSQRRPIPRTKR